MRFNLCIKDVDDFSYDYSIETKFDLKVKSYVDRKLDVTRSYDRIYSEKNGSWGHAMFMPMDDLFSFIKDDKIKVGIELHAGRIVKVKH